MLKLILFINALVFTTLTSVKAAPTVTTPGPVPIISNAAAIAGGLITQPSSNDRLEKLLTDANGNLLTGDALRQLTVFDFNNQKPADGARGGSILLATVDNFPILQDLGISGAISFIEPCGLNIPHLHPRADEVLITIEGILDTGFVMENGFNTEIETQLGKYQGTVFPMGSIHYQQNPTCDPAVFVAALNNEDPGRSDIATSFWMLQSEVINAALGFPTVKISMPGGLTSLSIWLQEWIAVCEHADCWQAIPLPLPTPDLQLCTPIMIYLISNTSILRFT